MLVDINNSTELSLSMPDNQFALLVQVFAREVSISVSSYGRYVFKFEGDAVILLFPAETEFTKACKNALNCSTAILEIIKEVINPIFKMQVVSIAKPNQVLGGYYDVHESSFYEQWYI